MCMIMKCNTIIRDSLFSEYVRYIPNVTNKTDLKNAYLFWNYAKNLFWDMKKQRYSLWQAVRGRKHVMRSTICVLKRAAKNCI